MFNTERRQKKARTMVCVLQDYLQKPLHDLSLLNVGGSAGIIDEFLSKYFKSVVGVDIDQQAIAYAESNFIRRNLSFEIGDAMNLRQDEASFDVVVSSQVYEHVPDARVMMTEIYRVLKPGGVCYFAAGNRLMWNEPHYNLPLLSAIPRPLAHLYLRLAGRGKFYYEKHLSYWGLRDLVRGFEVVDYTLPIITNPEKFSAEHMIPPGTRKAKLAGAMARHLIWLVPGYIWVLQKPGR